MAVVWPSRKKFSTSPLRNPAINSRRLYAKTTIASCEVNHQYGSQWVWWMPWAISLSAMPETCLP